jgi:hypothetical protein
MATIPHKRNFIVSLLNNEGEKIMDHNQKANLLWFAYKDRMSVAEFTGISYKINEPLQSHDLEELGNEFTQEEMDSVIKSLPNKKCWNLIKPEFYKLFGDFSNLNIDLRSINSSVIALVPKKGQS